MSLGLPTILDYKAPMYRGLRPTEFQEGAYFFFREAGSDELTMMEPQGNSYRMPYFVMVNTLRSLGFDETLRRTILDRVWNFRRVCYTTHDGRVLPYQEKRNKSVVVSPRIGP